MSVPGTTDATVKMGPTESSRLVWALVVSLLLHTLIWGGYETNKRYGWARAIHLPAWLEPIRLLVQQLQKQIQPPVQPKPAVPQQTPLLFVDVSPVQATEEAPANARYYSDKNSKAANPDPDKQSEVPRINGTQTRQIKTEDAPRLKYTPLQPTAPPKAQQADKEQAEEKPRPAQHPGDLTMGKPLTTPSQDPGQAEHKRPRTVREALARQQENRITGQKMMQEGGVSRHLEFSSLDTRATTFGAYDAAMIEAIQDRWFSLLDEHDFALEARGKVVLQFTLHSDGRITELRVAENTTNETLGLLCVKAVMDPSPYHAWSTAMRLEMGEMRHLMFTFYYY